MAAWPHRKPRQEVLVSGPGEAADASPPPQRRALLRKDACRAAARSSAAEEYCSHLPQAKAGCTSNWASL
eukprot:2335417-Alexandrium_andersonii.AAC.1